jgi:hypothetical protein
MTTQLITPNPNIPCTPGLCLVYVRETFGIGPKHPTAAAGWRASTTKHTDKNFPDAWVPVWFSLSDEPAGHVALRQPDGSIWSSSHPTSNTPTHHESLEDILSYYGNRMRYLGWTEDVEDVPVIVGAIPTIGADGVAQLAALPIDGPAIKLSVPGNNQDIATTSLINQIIDQARD